MADAQRPSPFGRSLTPPVAGGPSPFARPPGVGTPDTFRVTTAPERSAAPAHGASLPRGFMAGAVAAAVGAALWAGVTVLTGYQIGWMAIGVGALVGVAVRTAGKGTTTTFGILGALLALGGCLAGNFLAGAVVLSRHWDVSLAVLFTRLTPDLGVRLMTAMFSPMDLLFYALAVWQGYKFSIVPAN
jgi:predicted secreted protein